MKAGERNYRRQNCSSWLRNWTMVCRAGLPPLGDSPPGWVMRCRGRCVGPARALRTTRVVAERQDAKSDKVVGQKPNGRKETECR
jgi:hypothetical protein